MEATSGDGGDPARPGQRCRAGPVGGSAVPQLSVTVVPPGVDGAARADRQRMAMAGGDSGDSAQPGHLYRAGPDGGSAVPQLPVNVVPPGVYGAARADCQ